MQTIEVLTEIAPTRDVRVEIRFKNNLILRAMKEVGIKTARELSERSGISYATVIDIIGMRRPALNQRGDWHEAAFAIAAALHKEPEELFSWFQRSRALERNVFVLGEVASEAVLVPDSGDPERLLLQNELRGVVTSMLATLGERDRQAVQMRFGFDPYCRTHDYAEIGRALGGCSGSRAMMIVDRAVRRLRRHDRVRLLQSYRSVFNER
ncbi:sigma factor-like helix-turn-helix DNA-binding protein [Pseudorhodoplanes sp.]|uniref:sigma factor-like helix-turn-helix DNA-binding protein n=1 Tax=Pseudorhodoplanes sp. TaxID=1934341 RepID=UPI00391C7B49